MGPFLSLALPWLLAPGLAGCGASEEPYAHPFVVGDDVDSSPVTGEEDGRAVIEEEGWSTPVRMEVDDDGAEDSTYITRDGRYILFYYVPTWGGDDTDPKIYYTERPFQTREKHPISSDDFNGEAGPYISEAGDIYYSRTFIVLDPPPRMKNDRSASSSTTAPRSWTWGRGS